MISTKVVILKRMWKWDNEQCCIYKLNRSSDFGELVNNTECEYVIGVSSHPQEKRRGKRMDLKKKLPSAVSQCYML